MSTARWFDTDAEIEKLRGTPAKVAKVAKAEGEREGNFSRISNFSRGIGVKTHFSPPATENELYGSIPAKVAKVAKAEAEGEGTLAGLATLAGGQGQKRVFYTDAREDISPDALPWSCPACGSAVKLDQPVTEELPTRFWACQNCNAWGSTREGAHAPVSWITTRTLQ